MSLRKLREFLGLLNFHRRFMHGIARITLPLTDLLKVTAWSSHTPQVDVTCRNRLPSSQAALADATLLMHPLADAPLRLIIDPSVAAVGAVLQHQDDCYCPLGFFSQKLKPAETRYNTLSHYLTLPSHLGRRALVVGDSNESRVEGGVFTTLKEDRRVQVEAQSEKCTVDAMAKAQDVVRGSMDGEHLVVIHAGLNDVLKESSQNLEKQLEVGVRRLREASESVHVIICTIPEVQRQASETERRIVEANRVILLMSRHLRYGVMEVNREVYEARPHPFAQDGIHYGGAADKRVGRRIGRQATAFMGGPRALREPV
ncbi:uncharacterized protein LOC144127623 [Amblyomma americanum]